MNKQLARLLEIARKSKRTVLGLMSGTALDGLDIALCSCDDRSVKILQFATISFEEELRKRLASIQSKQWADLDQICYLNTALADRYATWVLHTLKEWNISTKEIDLIGCHGQTIYHRPDELGHSTLQLVDADHIAQKTGIITLSDFRQKHIAAGGQGAPLASLMDEQLFRDHTQHRMLLNLGGIANFTWLPSKKSGKTCFSSDSGPANTLINQAMTYYFNEPYDKDGEVAAAGEVNSELLKYLLLEPFFRKPFPKTTGQEDFNLELVEKLMQGYRLEVPPKNFVSTLTKLTYKSIEQAFETVTNGESYELFVSGGGIHNPVLMRGLKECLPKATLLPFEQLGMHPDAKEAALMAFLADACIQGRAFHISEQFVNLGKISLPD